MKVVGLITEYNPFHNGHAYHMQQARALTGADAVIVIMSGNFVQRGAPAIINKYDRAAMALSCGADLVLELPVCYATGSAELFASGAVSLLNKLGVVDSICFGSESGDIGLLTSLAKVLYEEPPAYRKILRQQLKTGQSYPAACTYALSCYLSEFSSSRHIMANPNNILGIEYIKAIMRSDSAITPYTISRSGAGYHHKNISYEEGAGPSSAMAIRYSIRQYGEPSYARGQMPDSAYRLLMSASNISFPIYENDFSALLHYKLLSECTAGYANYADVPQALSDKILHSLNQYTEFSEFCDILKSRDLIYTRICRCLTHIMLNILQDDVQRYIDGRYPAYARMLGFRQESTALLATLKERSEIPLISKLADAKWLLDKPELSMLEDDIRIAHIYEAVAARKFDQPFQNEYQRKIIRYQEGS